MGEFRRRVEQHGLYLGGAPVAAPRRRARRCGRERGSGRRRGGSRAAPREWARGTWAPPPPRGQRCSTTPADALRQRIAAPAGIPSEARGQRGQGNSPVREGNSPVREGNSPVRARCPRVVSGNRHRVGLLICYTQGSTKGVLWDLETTGGEGETQRRNSRAVRCGEFAGQGGEFAGQGGEFAHPRAPPPYRRRPLRPRPHGP
eukprot:1193456-Prorocentrum_minimum.AAC.1